MRNTFFKPSQHLSGHGCLKCCIRKVTKTYQQFEKEAKNKHKSIYRYYQDYINNHTNISIFCNICKNTFKQKPYNHLIGNGCPNCASLKTENEIRKLISKITRLKFKKVHLLELNGLELDMYNHRKRLAIEYNGEGHYLRYDNGWGFRKKENIISHQKRDRKKKLFCKKQGIKLIIIPCYKYKKFKTIKEKREYLYEVLSKNIRKN